MTFRTTSLTALFLTVATPVWAQDDAPLPPIAPTAAPATTEVDLGERPVPFRYRFAPTSNLLLVGYSSISRAAVMMPSLRLGVRFAVLERTKERYAPPPSVALQLGLEGHTSASTGALWGVGVTARAGHAIVSKGGYFFPFFEGYALGTLAVLPTSSGAVVAGHLGLGVNLNAYAFASDSFLLGLILPNVEVVWSLPTRVDPGAHGVELRVGLGF